MADSHGSNSRNYYNDSNQKNLNHSPFVLIELLKTKSNFFLFNTYLMDVLKYKLSPNLSLYKFEDIVIFLFIKILIKKKFSRKEEKHKENTWLDHESNP